MKHPFSPPVNKASQALADQLSEQSRQLQVEGLYKHERVIASRQQAEIRLQDGREVLNFCANNYLGLANHPELIKAAREGVYVIGFSYPVVPRGKARIRTQMSAIHTREHLDRAVAAFVKAGHQLGVID